MVSSTPIFILWGSIVSMVVVSVLFMRYWPPAWIKTDRFRQSIRMNVVLIIVWSGYASVTWFYLLFLLPKENRTLSHFLLGILIFCGLLLVGSELIRRICEIEGRMKV